jgi:molybdopterin/thiamine biosynthesis adenylyltransferase
VQARVPWFDRWPELAAWELARFRARGLPAAVDEEAKAAGRFVVKSQVRFRDRTVDIEVRYPAETPELPPEVFAEPGLLDRHQHPFGGNFCLLERPLDDWPAGSWGAADLIAERLGALLADTAAGPEVVRAAEAPMPEPYTAYYNHPLGPVVLMPGELSSPHGEGGSLRLRLFDKGNLRFVVEAVDGTGGDQTLLELLPPGEVVEARWKRVAGPPPGPDGPSVAAWARTNHPGLLRPPVPRKLAGSRHLAAPKLEVVALVFEEEGPGVGQGRDAWLFLCLPRGEVPFLTHWQVVSAKERFRRIPELVGLRERRAVVVGLGTLGGEIAVGLAKAGLGTLDLVDHDRFEANNAVRHVLGIEWSGLPKTLAVANACRRANPFCQAQGHDLFFGETVWEGPSATERLGGLLHGVDVVVESTGSHQLQRLIARLAAEAGVPFVSSWLTEGFCGAEIVRIVPDTTSCFVCFARAQAAGELPRAEAGPDNPVVVQGCSHPTVSGAGFDASETAALTTRLAVQTILRDERYPDSSWDYAAVSFRGGTEGQQAPRVATKRLSSREGCVRCDPAAGSNAVR